MMYSETQISQIEQQIMADHKRRIAGTFSIDGKQVRNDWDEGAFLSEDLYEDFLRAVQLEKKCKATGLPYTVDSSFPDYLRDCLETLSYRVRELSGEQEQGIIDLQTYNAAKEVAERAITAIRRYLDKSERGQLIGV